MQTAFGYKSIIGNGVLMEQARSEEHLTQVPQRELEFDLVHGSSLEDVTQPLILFWNRKGAVQGLNRQTKWMWFIHLPILAIPIIPALFSKHVAIQSLGLGFVFFSAIFCILIAWWSSTLARRDFTESLDPILEIRKEGLTIRCPTRNFENIPWDEIEEIRAFNFFGRRFIGIVPKDLEKTLSHARNDQSRLGRTLALTMLSPKNSARLNSAVHSAFKGLGVFSPPIQIPAHWLPLPADELVEILNARRIYFISIQSEEEMTALESD